MTFESGRVEFCDVIRNSSSSGEASIKVAMVLPFLSTNISDANKNGLPFNRVKNPWPWLKFNIVGLGCLRSVGAGSALALYNSRQLPLSSINNI